MTSISEIEYGDGQTGGDPYVFLRSEGNDVPSQRGSQILEVRAFTKKPKSDGDVAQEISTTGEAETSGAAELTDEVEISGADCILKGDLFSAKVVTPGGVRVPLYGYRTADLSIECSKEGFESAVAIVKTYNETFARRNSSAASGGLIGVLVIGLFNAVSDETDDDFEYLFTPVLLKKLAEQTS